ncbi:hypothetical protein V1525DRAFT_388698 [Lipomyces kononenkoae]|uniref:Uncharacterized protein n=1 Tax=Lipomyces kononenkoae TaxID=34357 RepID=A0ACC3T2C2_LIPKO
MAQFATGTSRRGLDLELDSCIFRNSPKVICEDAAESGVSAFPVSRVVISLRPRNFSQRFPSFDHSIAAIVTITLTTFIAILNVKTNAWLTGFFLIIEILALLALLALGFTHTEKAQIEEVGENGPVQKKRRQFSRRNANQCDIKMKVVER